jgi:hypothetical protein
MRVVNGLQQCGRGQAPPAGVSGTGVLPGSQVVMSAYHGGARPQSALNDQDATRLVTLGARATPLVQL